MAEQEDPTQGAEEGSEDPTQGEGNGEEDPTQGDTGPGETRPRRQR
jgi:hypothetical protein